MNATARPPMKYAISCPCGWARSWTNGKPSSLDDAMWDREMKALREYGEGEARDHIASGRCPVAVRRGAR